MCAVESNAVRPLARRLHLIRRAALIFPRKEKGGETACFSKMEERLLCTPGLSNCSPRAAVVGFNPNMQQVTLGS